MELDSYSFTAIWEGEYQGNDYALPFQFNIILNPEADEDLIPQAARAILTFLAANVLSYTDTEDV